MYLSYHIRNYNVSALATSMGCNNIDALFASVRCLATLAQTIRRHLGIGILLQNGNRGARGVGGKRRPTMHFRPPFVAIRSWPFIAATEEARTVVGRRVGGTSLLPRQLAA